MHLQLLQSVLLFINIKIYGSVSCNFSLKKKRRTETKSLGNTVHGGADGNLSRCSAGLLVVSRYSIEHMLSLDSARFLTKTV